MGHAYKHRSEFPNYDAFISLSEDHNGADPDEMQHFAAFHLGLHCFPKFI